MIARRTASSCTNRSATAATPAAPARRQRRRGRRGSGGCRAWRARYGPRGGGLATGKRRGALALRSTNKGVVVHAGSPQRDRARRGRAQAPVSPQPRRRGVPRSAGRAGGGASQSQDRPTRRRTPPDGQLLDAKSARAGAPAQRAWRRRRSMAAAATAAAFAPGARVDGADRLPPAGGRPVRRRSGRDAQKAGAGAQASRS